MPIGDQDQGGITLAITATLGGGDQLLDLGRVRYSRVRSSALGRLTGTVRFSLLGATTLKCGFTGISPAFAIATYRTSYILRTLGQAISAPAWSLGFRCGGAITTLPRASCLSKREDFLPLAN